MTVLGVVERAVVPDGIARAPSRDSARHHANYHPKGALTGARAPIR